MSPLGRVRRARFFKEERRPVAEPLAHCVRGPSRVQCARRRCRCQCLPLRTGTPGSRSRRPLWLGLCSGPYLRSPLGTCPRQVLRQTDRQHPNDAAWRAKHKRRAGCGIRLGCRRMCWCWCRRRFRLAGRFIRRGDQRMGGFFSRRRQPPLETPSLPASEVFPWVAD